MLSRLLFFLNYRLQDVVHSEKRIYLVFEYLELDLKKHMDSCPDLAKDPRLVKVRPSLHLRLHPMLTCMNTTNPVQPCLVTHYQHHMFTC